MPDQTLLTSIRSRLLGERARLTEQIRELGGETPLGYDSGFADSGQVAAVQGENRALLGQLTEQIAELDRALGKLEAGSYGHCEVCGGPIAEPRLEAMPATRYCINHA